MHDHIIRPAVALTLPGLFQERIRRDPQNVAYRYFDRQAQQWQSFTWTEIGNIAGRWQGALRQTDLKIGDRAAVMLPNSCEWVLFDQAVMSLGLVSVPLYIQDRPDNAAYVLNNSGARLLLVQTSQQWQQLLASDEPLKQVQYVISLAPIASEHQHDKRLIDLATWLSKAETNIKISAAHNFSVLETLTTDQLASIVYTSGTTGHPKGVMLSHGNMLENAWAGVQSMNLGPGHLFLSFLPLSHTLERTVGYYLAMMIGATVAYNREIPLIAEDLINIKPTILVSVPSIYERIYQRIQNGLLEKPFMVRFLFKTAVAVGWQRFLWQQKRRRWSPTFLLWPLLNKLVARKLLDRLGGRLSIAICGGAALPFEVAKTFIGLGLNLLQGYGLTEASPVISVNRPQSNKPASIGPALPGVKVRIGADDELQSQSAAVMQGYWHLEEATKNSFTEDGWLRTGDKARIDEDGHIYITGRLKDIIVLSNGEKLPPADMEMAIVGDSLFEQVVVIGEGRPYLTAIAVLANDAWQVLAKEQSLDPKDENNLRAPAIMELVLARMGQALKDFPGYAQIRNVHLTTEAWTVENGLLTPSLKIKRQKVKEQFADIIEQLYQKH
ncbi:MAG: long-chain fatty acid--CoA ligase [Gammaproteobacteria bacterium]|nr:long-chain fatty acid--CoA ligase [Gammaproteobacteria bacterium]